MVMGQSVSTNIIDFFTGPVITSTGWLVNMHKHNKWSKSIEQSMSINRVNYSSMMFARRISQHVTKIEPAININRLSELAQPLYFIPKAIVVFNAADFSKNMLRSMPKNANSSVSASFGPSAQNYWPSDTLYNTLFEPTYK